MVQGQGSGIVFGVGVERAGAEQRQVRVDRYRLRQGVSHERYL